MLRSAAIAIVCVAIAAQAVTTARRQTLKDVPTVPSLNVSEYLGLWYQMYGDAFNGIFEKNPYCATATYGVNDNGTISVLNQDRSGSYDAPKNIVEGYAYQTDPLSYPGQLAVVFPFNPIPGPYWITKLGPVVDGQYQYSIVTDNDRLSLFVLARDVAEFETRYKASVLSFLAANGFDGVFNAPEVVPQGSQCSY